MSATNELMLVSCKVAALTEHVSTAYLLLSTANMLDFLYCFPKINDSMPLPHPKSKIVLGVYFIF